MYWNICTDTNLIQSFNLHRTCKNLLLQIHSDCNNGDAWTDFKIAIEAMFHKQDYYSLENFNLLLVFHDPMSMLSQLSRIDWLFDLLKQKKQILKYQFKQFNIGLRDVTHDVYHVIEWNPGIDDEYLDNIWHQCKEKHDVFNTDNSKQKQHPNFKKYHMWLNQWSSL